MFFPRLRRRAKWVFVLLAASFSIGFLAFGVGTGVQGTSIGDVFRNILGGSGPSGPSVADAQKKLDKNPKDTVALLELANAYQVKGDTDGAIAALERYRALRPKDLDGLKQLAGAYSLKASQVERQAAAVQVQEQTQLFGQTFGPPASTPFGQALSADPIAEALRQQASQRLSAAIQDAQKAYRKVADVYVQLTLLEPVEPSDFFALGDASQRAGDTTSAVAAYKQFLKLSPDDSFAPIVRDRLKALDSSTPTVTTSSTPPATTG
jgi:tetratricopeptide (TPR) repeat protein